MVERTIHSAGARSPRDHRDGGAEGNRSQAERQLVLRTLGIIRQGDIRRFVTRDR